MYDKEHGLYIAHCSDGALSIVGKMANRHGLIAGATGTGKTVTLQVMAESFCQAGVPCFMADMKGDLSGISQVGKISTMFSVNRVTPCAPPSRRWDRNSYHASFNSTRHKMVCSTSCSASPTSVDCSSSI